MPTLLLVGCGKMGGALLEGWLEAGAASAVHVVEPHRAALPDDRRVRAVDSPEDLPSDLAPDAVVLAVKPQAMDEALPAYGRFAAPRTVFLSIAAGKTLDYFGRSLGDSAAVVRAMPNTPAAVRRGITVACASTSVSDGQRDLCDRLLAAVGEVAWVDDESLIDPVTALSGGGPAYVFLLIETLARAGVAVGLPDELAMRLARATVCGSGELAVRSPDSAHVLRQNVTSPGGTTAEALKVLMAPDGLQPLFDKAIAEATRRSRELAS